MNISNEIVNTDGSNFSSYLFHNGTEVEDHFSVIPILYLVSGLLGFPINSYVIWLIMTETKNGLAAEFSEVSILLSLTFLYAWNLFVFF